MCITTDSLPCIKRIITYNASPSTRLHRQTGSYYQTKLSQSPELNQLTAMQVAVTLLANDCSFCSWDDKDLYTNTDSQSV